MGCKIGPDHENPDRARGEKVRGSHDHVGIDRGKVEEQYPRPKNHDTYRSDDKKFGCHDNMEIRAKTSKIKGWYICSGTHDYESCESQEGVN